MPPNNQITIFSLNSQQTIKPVAKHRFEEYDGNK